MILSKILHHAMRVCLQTNFQNKSLITLKKLNFPVSLILAQMRYTCNSKQFPSYRYEFTTLQIIIHTIKRGKTFICLILWRCCFNLNKKLMPVKVVNSNYFCLSNMFIF